MSSFQLVLRTYFPQKAGICDAKLSVVLCFNNLNRSANNYLKNWIARFNEYQQHWIRIKVGFRLLFTVISNISSVRILKEELKMSTNQ